MNKYQEALDYVNKSVCTAMSCLGVNDTKTKESLHILQELVDKATPKKTIKEPIIKDGYGQYKHYCPICKQELLILGDYCLNCGQAVDWS